MVMDGDERMKMRRKRDENGDGWGLKGMDGNGHEDSDGWG